MANYLNKAGLQVDARLVTFVETEALPGSGIGAEAYWAGLAGLVAKFMPRNRELLAIRDRMQKQIDDWHHKNGPVAKDPEGYQTFLRQIGYVVPEPGDFQIETSGLDPEISTICGPQNSLWPTAGSCESARTRNRTCSGPSAVVAETSVLPPAWNTNFTPWVPPSPVGRSCTRLPAPASFCTSSGSTRTY